MRQASIGAGIETLGAGAFGQCIKMTKLTFTGDPKTIGKDLVKHHNSRLMVVCPKSVSVVYIYFVNNYNDINLQAKPPKKK